MFNYENMTVGWARSSCAPMSPDRGCEHNNVCLPQVDHGADREALGEGPRLLEEEGEV